MALVEVVEDDELPVGHAVDGAEVGLAELGRVGVGSGAGSGMLPSAGSAAAPFGFGAGSATLPAPSAAP